VHEHAYAFGQDAVGFNGFQTALGMHAIPSQGLGGPLCQASCRLEFKT
jgi:hypothetical protein